VNALPTAPGAALSLAASPRRRGVVLVNVGTPQAPTVPAVRAYLREFLGDPFVIDLPGPARWLLLNLVILPFRPSKSTHAYQAIWTPDGSPLLVNSQAQARALAARLPEAEVVLAMRYGLPSLRAAVEHLRARGVTDVTLVPMYPQEASATTGTTVKAFGEASPGARVLPAFFAAPGFVGAVASNVRETVARSGAEFVLFSYHGLPVRQVARICQTSCDGVKGLAGECPPLGPANASCYRAQCYATTAAVAREAGVLARCSTSFQSRLKGASWLSPFTDDTLTALGQRGVKRLAVACPSFVADCLETLEEIGLRGAETFLAAGGEHLELVPAVNAAPAFIDTLAELLRARWEES
jgi:ferrochelatase